MKKLLAVFVFPLLLSGCISIGSEQSPVGGTSFMSSADLMPLSHRLDRPPRQP